MRTRLGQLGALAALLTVAAPARAATFTVAIGYNGVGRENRPDLLPLRYADDDAIAVHTLSRELGGRSYLLTLSDPDTLDRHGDAAAGARPPSLVALRQVIAELRAALAEASQRGEASQVIIFYSGHGWRADNGEGALALLDGELTRAVLYDEVLAALPAGLVHLLVDACHAEAVVRPRDLRARSVDVGEAAVSDYLQKQTLARFPHVGAVIATTSSAEAHEWDRYRAGVFTHELLSALRGAADVDGDRRIEYSELGAFLAAANREVADRRALLQTVVTPPSLDAHAAVVDLRPARSVAWLVGRPAFLGSFSVETGRGVRVADLRAEPEHRIELAVPADQTLHLRSSSSEGEVRLRPGQRQPFEGLALAPTSTRPRGAVDSALRRGLFQTSFGPAYYRGFVDRDESLVAVRLPELEAATRSDARPAIPGAWRRPAAWLAFGASGALAVTAGAFGWQALQARSEYRRTSFELPAAQARARHDDARAWALSALLGAVVSAGAGALFSWSAPH
jgi:hypothetical protein